MDEIAKLVERLQAYASGEIFCSLNDAKLAWSESATALSNLIRDHEALKEQLETAKDDAHYANGVADLAMQHRDVAETELKALKAKTLAVIEPFAEEANLIDADDTKPIWSVITIWSTTAKPLIVGHLRAARALTDELKEKGDV